MEEIKIKSNFGNGSYAYVTDAGKLRNIPKELAIKVIKMQRELIKLKK